MRDLLAADRDANALMIGQEGSDFEAVLAAGEEGSTSSMK
jgi:hypothetical protein